MQAWLSAVIAMEINNLSTSGKILCKKMRNNVQHYAWGSKHALTELYGIENPSNQPMAELWMGAHPKSSSLLLDEQGQAQSLRDLINKDPSAFFGCSSSKTFW
ncbi:hypothetical protein DZS_24130 [Dickeya ananatis]